MPSVSRNAFAVIVLNSREEISGDHTLDRRKAYLLQVAKKCGFRVHRKWMFDLADQPSDAIDPPLSWLRAGEVAASKGWALIADFAVDLPVLQTLRARWREKGVNLLDLETLVSDEDSLHVNDAGSAHELRHAEAVETGRVVVRSRRTPGSMIITHDAAALAHAEASNLRRKTFATWLQQARAAGAESTQEIADWLNARGIRTARNFLWKRENVQRMLVQIEGKLSSRLREHGSLHEPITQPDESDGLVVVTNSYDEPANDPSHGFEDSQCTVDIFSDEKWQEIEDAAAVNDRQPINDYDKEELEAIEVELDSVLAQNG